MSGNLGLMLTDEQANFPLWASGSKGVGSYESLGPSSTKVDLEPGEGLKSKERTAPSSKKKKKKSNFENKHQTPVKELALAS